MKGMPLRKNLKCASMVPSPLALDLTYLWWVDAAGIKLLNTLAEAGAQLRGVSPYIALLLGRSGA